MQRVYGIKFFVEKSKSELTQTYLPVGEANLEDLLNAIRGYSETVALKATFGVIKELTLNDQDKIVVNSPAKFNGEKNEAFILKREGDRITGGGNEYSLNGNILDLGFDSYNVNIVEIKN